MVEGSFLFIDDELIQHKILSHTVRDLGYDNQIIDFYNGLEALNYLRTESGKIFLIISDIHMPVMNGLQLKEEIESDPLLKKKAIPFIFYSSSGKLEEIEKAYSLGIQGYLDKFNDVATAKDSLQKVIECWSVFVHPSKYNI